MRSLPVVLSLLSATDVPPPASKPVSEIFQVWEQAVPKVHSLLVEFEEETKDSLFQEQTRDPGTLILARTSNGAVLPTYSIRRTKPIFTHDIITALFVDGNVYLLTPQKKHALRIDLTHGGAAELLGRYINPPPR